MLVNRLVRVYDRIFAPVYIVSYPKAGRTWLRALLAETLFKGFEKDAIDVTAETRFRRGMPTILFTHAEANIDNQAQVGNFYQGKRILILVRDPRDVVISSYFEYTRRRDVFQGDVSLSEFIRNPEYGIEKIVDFYNQLLLQNATILSVVKYEDLRTDTERTFKDILLTIGVLDIIDADAVHRAVTETEFTKMQLKAKSSQDSRLAATDQNDPESQKVRKGKIGGYTDYLNDDDIELVNRAFKKLAPEYGYKSNKQS